MDPPLVLYRQCTCCGMKCMLATNFQTSMMFIVFCYVLSKTCKGEQNHTGVNKIRNQTNFISFTTYMYMYATGTVSVQNDVN